MQKSDKQLHSSLLGFTKREQFRSLRLFKKWWEQINKESLKIQEHKKWTRAARWTRYEGTTETERQRDGDRDRERDKKNEN